MMKALVLAAGFGTRLQPLTHTTAKPAIYFLGLPLIAYPLNLIDRAGVSDIIVNAHHLPLSVEAAVNLLTPFLESKVSFSHELPVILNSGGAIDKIRETLESCDNFLLVNADSVINFHHQDGLSRLIESHLKNKSLATLLTCDYPGVGYSIGGVISDKFNRVVSIGKLTSDHTKLGLEEQVKHYTGYMVLNKKILDFTPRNQPSHIFTDVLLPAIRSGEVVISHSESLDWYETGNLESFKQAEIECHNLLQSETQSNCIKDCHQQFRSILARK